MTIFGISADLPFVTAHTTFIGFLIFLVLLEYFFEWLEKLAEHAGIELLFEKLKKELMMLGNYHPVRRNFLASILPLTLIHFSFPPPHPTPPHLPHPTHRNRVFHCLHLHSDRRTRNWGLHIFIV